MNKDISRVLISKEDIEKKVKELGNQISKDYIGKRLLLIGILKGSVVFFSDLMRAIDIPLEIEFLCVSSYGSSSVSSGEVKVLKDTYLDISGYDVLIIEDIIDTGITLNFVKKMLEKRNVKSFKICALLDKRQRRKVKIDTDYTGFVIPDEFVVGYGLDYNEAYRNIPYIGVLKSSVYSGYAYNSREEGVKIFEKKF